MLHGTLLQAEQLPHKCHTLLHPHFVDLSASDLHTLQTKLSTFAGGPAQGTVATGQSAASGGAQAPLAPGPDQWQHAMGGAGPSQTHVDF